MSIDIVFIAVFGYGFWQGYSRGIIGTLFNAAAYIFGVVLAFKTAPVTVNIIERLFNSNNPTMVLAAFIVNLVFIMFIMRQAAKGMESAFEAAYLGVINQTLGGALMGGLAVTIYSVLLWFLVKVQFLETTTIEQSRTYPFLKELPGRARSVVVRLKPLAEEFWASSMDMMNRIEKYGVDKTEDKSRIIEVPDDGASIEEEPVFSPPPKRSSPPPANDSGIE
jgi:uncharacterized membrane protein required for colicin V production